MQLSSGPHCCPGDADDTEENRKYIFTLMMEINPCCQSGRRAQEHNKAAVCVFVCVCALFFVFMN